MTKSLIDLYVESRGVCEVPRQWFVWAALSGIAAAVGDRIKIQQGDGAITANLYVFLIGKSGSGKENAIKGISKMLHQIPIANAYAGQTTAAALTDYLGRKTMHDFPVNEKVFLITEELAYGVGGREQAEMLVRLMTDLYSQKGYASRQGTRKQGQVELQNPLANWLAGSTEGWLQMAISKEAIESGFWARVLGVRGRREVERRISRIVRPANYREMEDEMLRRMWELSTLGPEVLKLSPEAERLQDEWYQNRVFPTDEAGLPSAYKADVTIHKVAGLLKMADIDVHYGTNYHDEIEWWHWRDAVVLLTPIFEGVSHFMDLAAGSKSHTALQKVRYHLQQAGEMPRHELTKKCGGRGVTAREIADAIEVLMEEGSILKQPTAGRRGETYVWVKPT